MNDIIEILKPTIKKPIISLDYTGTQRSDDKNEIKLGSVSPLIQIGGFYFESDAITSFSLEYGSDFLPTISAVINDSTSSIETELSGIVETIDVFIRSDDEDYNSISATFLITSFDNISDNKYSMNGELFIKGINNKIIKSYSNNSFDTILDVCKELGVGFASNITTTDDNQKWLRILQGAEEFIKEVSSSSYVSENGIIDVWIDPYYSLNFFNIDESASNKKEQFDKVSEITLQKNYTSENDNQLRDFVLSNHRSKNGTVNYIETYKSSNNFGDIEKEYGLERIVKTNNIDNKNLYFEYKIQVGNVDISSEERSGNNTRSSNIGFTTRNCHLNYGHSIISNKINGESIKTKRIRITTKSINPTVYVGQYAPIIIMNNNVNMNDRKGNDDNGGINKKLSGEYIIKSIEYKYRKKTFKSIIEAYKI